MLHYTTLLNYCTEKLKYTGSLVANDWLLAWSTYRKNFWGNNLLEHVSLTIWDVMLDVPAPSQLLVKTASTIRPSNASCPGNSSVVLDLCQQRSRRPYLFAPTIKLVERRSKQVGLSQHFIAHGIYLYIYIYIWYTLFVLAFQFVKWNYVYNAEYLCSFQILQYSHISLETQG